MNASSPQGELSSFEKFPALGLLSLICISIATLGIYTWWWMYSRSVILNNALPPEQRISLHFMHLCLGGFVVTMVLAIALGFGADSEHIIDGAQYYGHHLGVALPAWRELLVRPD